MVTVEAEVLLILLTEPHTHSCGKFVVDKMVAVEVGEVFLPTEPHTHFRWMFQVEKLASKIVMEVEWIHECVIINLYHEEDLRTGRGSPGQQCQTLVSQVPARTV